MNEFEFLSEMYIPIFNWLAGNTPGERNTKGYFKKYDKNVWNKIRKKIIEIESKKEKTYLEKEFLKCKYIGKVYRKIPFRKRRKGYVYPINHYQSCSKSLNGLNEVSIHGDIILIELFSSDISYSIDIIRLLKFMFRNNLIRYKDEFEEYFNNIGRLERYIDEEEVIVVISRNHIMNMTIRNFKKNLCIQVDKEKWYRTTID